jgi:hypothetical protein
MSAFASTHDNWLNLKHHTKPSCVYGFACGLRDNDWDFADTPSRGYSFSSEDSPMQLRNNSGGMDEDDVSVKDVWYPHQATREFDAEKIDSEMSDDHPAAACMAMDVEHQQQHEYFQHNPVAPATNKRKRKPDNEINSGVSTYGCQQMTFDSAAPKRARVGA